VPEKLPNLYSPPSLPEADPQTSRVIRDLVDRINFLTTEVDRVGKAAPISLEGYAAKEKPIQGIITIPARDSGGQDGLIKVSKDGVISSYVNASESIFPYIDLSTAGNVGGGVDPLHGYSLQAGVLANDGDFLLIKYAGNIAANDNDKQIIALFDSQTFIDTASNDLDLNVGWMADVIIARLSSTSVRAASVVSMNIIRVDSGNVVNTLGAGGVLFARTVTLTGVANLNSSAVTIQVQGQGTADNDITQNLSEISYYRPRTVKLV